MPSLFLTKTWLRLFNEPSWALRWEAARRLQSATVENLVLASIAAQTSSFAPHNLTDAPYVDDFVELHNLCIDALASSIVEAERADAIASIEEIFERWKMREEQEGNGHADNQ